MPTDVEDDDNGQTLPEKFDLGQNRPNPFNMSTVIEFSVASKSRVTIEVYNVLGQKIRTLVDETKPAGNYSVTWDGVDQDGADVASGVYLYRIKTGDFSRTNKMLLLK